MREPNAAEDAPEMLRQLALSALAHWNMQASEIHLVKMRENAVFRVVDVHGKAFALRVHHQGYHSDAALRSELQWMAALQAAGIDVPTLVPAVDGRLFVSVQAHAGLGLREGRQAHQVRQVDLFEWISGRPLGTSEAGLTGDLDAVEHCYERIGSIMARLHNQAGGWQRPSGFQRHSWDLEGLVGERPLWGRFWELEALSSEQRQLLIRARDRVRRELHALAGSLGADSHYGLIHADFVPENLLLADDGSIRLLDFDDAGFGWHQFELATALYFIQDDARFEAAKAALIAGYRQHRVLTDETLGQLPVFMMARGFTYLGWVHTRPGSKDGQAITPHLIRLACRQACRLLG